MLQFYEKSPLIGHISPVPLGLIHNLQLPTGSLNERLGRVLVAKEHTHHTKSRKVVRTNIGVARETTLELEPVEEPPQIRRVLVKMHWNFAEEPWKPLVL